MGWTRCLLLLDANVVLTSQALLGSAGSVVTADACCDLISQLNSDPRRTRPPAAPTDARQYQYCAETRPSRTAKTSRQCILAVVHLRVIYRCRLSLRMHDGSSYLTDGLRIDRQPNNACWSPEEMKKMSSRSKACLSHGNIELVSPSPKTCCL